MKSQPKLIIKNLSLTFEEDVIKVESYEPEGDKRYIDNTPSATDVVFEALDVTEATKPAELITTTGLSNDNVYQALKRLKDQNLVKGDRHGYIKVSDKVSE